MKKLFLAVLIFIVITVIFAFTPHASGLYEAICLQQLKARFGIKANFETFQVQPFKKINCTMAVLDKHDNKVQVEEAAIQIIKIKPFQDYLEIRLDSKKLEITNVNGKMLPLADIISKQTDGDILKSAKLECVNFNLIKDKGKIKIYDIEAVGNQLKVYGAIDIIKNRGICSLAIHVPAKKTEGMSKFSKSVSKLLFDMEQEGNWTIFTLTNFPFKI